MVTQEERREATRKAVLRAAQRHFGSFGYNSVTVDQIAADADVAKGAIYHYFPTKAHLFEAVVQAVAARIRAEVQAALVQQPDVLTAMFAGQRAFFATC